MLPFTSALATPATEGVLPTPTPTVTLPPDGQRGFPFLSEVIDLDSVGYIEDEVFIEGTARSYVPDGSWTGVTDGQWNARPDGPEASYKTRLLIRRPADAADFNGIVLMDWMNVTAGRDGDAFGGISSELIGQGYAYVGVSAQAVGVNFMVNTWETGEGARYASLHHPGDSHSYDIFSQAAKSVVDPDPNGPAPLGNLTDAISGLVAYGASQSGARLITYHNAVHPSTRLYDAFLILVTNSSSLLSQTPLPVVQTPSGNDAHRIRTDVSTPVLYVNSETEFVTGGRRIHAQPDSPTFRLWEFPGSAHATRPGVEASMARLQKSGVQTGIPMCDMPTINDLDFSVAIKAANRTLWEWIDTGKPPRSAPRAALDIPADISQPVSIIRDPATGIAEGGIRLPDVDVPTRTLVGTRPPESVNPPFMSCGLFGGVDPWNGDSDPWDANPNQSLTPIPEPTLSDFYNNPAHYRAMVRQSVNRLVAHGYLLPEDAEDILNRAQTVDFPEWPNWPGRGVGRSNK